MTIAMKRYIVVNPGSRQCQGKHFLGVSISELSIWQIRSDNSVVIKSPIVEIGDDLCIVFWTSVIMFPCPDNREIL